jgi:hypothetical protein
MFTEVDVIAALRRRLSCSLESSAVRALTTSSLLLCNKMRLAALGQPGLKKMRTINF